MEGSKDEAPRIDEWLVAAFVRDSPDRQKFISALHGHIDFFSDAAGSPFSVTAPHILIANDPSGRQSCKAQLAFFRRVLTLRTAALLPEVVRSLNESRLLSFALAVRGILETAAVAAYQSSQLVLPLDTDILLADYARRLQKAVMASRFDWGKFFTDRAGRQALIDKYDAAERWSELEPPDTVTNILTMFKALARRLRPTLEKARGIVFHDYSLLSDLCHPAAGSYLIFLAGVEPEMRAELVPPKSTVVAHAELLLPCVGYSVATIVDVLAELEGVDERLGGAGPAATPAAHA